MQRVGVLVSPLVTAFFALVKRRRVPLWYFANRFPTTTAPSTNPALPSTIATLNTSHSHPRPA